MMAAAQAAAEAALAQALAEEANHQYGQSSSSQQHQQQQLQHPASVYAVGGGGVGSSAMAAAMAAAAAAADAAEEADQQQQRYHNSHYQTSSNSHQQQQQQHLQQQQLAAAAGVEIDLLGMPVPVGGGCPPLHLQPLDEQQLYQQQQQLEQMEALQSQQHYPQHHSHPYQQHQHQQPQHSVLEPHHLPHQHAPQQQLYQQPQQQHPHPQHHASLPSDGLQAQVLKDLLGVVNDNGNTATQLLQLLATEGQQNNSTMNPQQHQQQQHHPQHHYPQQQQQQQHPHHHHAADSPLLQSPSVDASSNMNILNMNNHNHHMNNTVIIPPRREQLMTISQNGTILEATETVLGFPPDALLMTSAYHTMHDLDLPGFLFVKTHFWDKGEPNVEVYIRRRNIEGELVWLASKALEYVTHPIPGIIIVESLVSTEMEEQLASSLNRITRITAILVQAVEAATLTWAKQPPGSSDNNGNNISSSNDNPAAAGVAAAAVGEETCVLQSLISTIQETGARNPDDGKALQELLQIVAATAKMNNGQLEPSEEEIMKNLGQKEKGFDPFWMMEKVRKGVRLDLGMTRLFPEEVKMIALVLSGKVSVDIVAPRVLMALRSGQGLGAAFPEFKLDIEKDKSPRRLHGSGSSGSASGLSGSRGGGGGIAGYNSDGVRSGSLSNFPPAPQPVKARLSKTSIKAPPPPISVINVSYTFIGNIGMEMLSEVIYMDGSALRTIDVSFCGLEEKGMLAFARALARRKKKDIPPIKGLILSGNVLTARAASELGMALVGSLRNGRNNRSRSSTNTGGGYDTDNTDSGGEEDDDDDDFNSNNDRRSASGGPRRRESKESGLQLLHLASTSLTPEAVRRLLDGLGPDCSLRELSLASNALGAAGTSALVKFLEKGKDRSQTQVPMPFLDRLDMSNNNLGDDGTTQLTRAILKRSKVHLVDLQLSSNAITSVGVETMMNKLLNHNLVSLSLYKNLIGDQGCQLVAASLQSMKALSRLNLSFNQIGSRGIISLMRRLISCESITFLGLSGNILKISGAIALAYTLSQHPRLEELHLDNCCLSQAAQCHIVAGIISNRWVPMKRLMGYAVGPPMVAIGALKQYSPNMNNEECFRIRKDEQMKTILRWMETNRVAKQTGITPDPNLAAAAFTDASEQRFLSPDFISNINDVHGTPSQNSYLRLLGWLSLIPFDDDELTALQKYFFDGDGGEGDRGSDGYINLKLRGDLLAALDSEMADEIREELPSLAPSFKGSVGLHLSTLDLRKLEDISNWNAWKAFKGQLFERPSQAFTVDDSCVVSADMEVSNVDSMKASEHSGNSQAGEEQEANAYEGKMPRSDSTASATTKEKSKNKAKPRISMFPKFEQQLEDLKATAAEMIEQEEDPMHHEVILTQYAEASLTILRQLRYHCMNRGLDGWVHGGLKRKILIVDDSRVTRKLVSQAFEKANFIVDTAANGAEGVEKLKASIYDIAFMDIDMPVMNGFEATKTLRKWEDTMRPGARQPICALTATYVDDFERSDLMKFKEAGLDVMESKPCNIPRLFKVVDDVAPMMSDLRISISQRERSDPSLNKAATTDSSN